MICIVLENKGVFHWMVKELKPSKFIIDLFISEAIDNKFNLWTTTIFYISLVFWLSIII